MSIRLCIIGGGLTSAVGKAHVAALRMSGKFTLVGGSFSKDRVKSIMAAEQYGCTFTNPEPVFEKGVCDRVVILSPTPEHFRHVETFLLLEQFPVLCEKALSENSEQAQKLVRISKERNVPLSVVYNYAFYPAVQKMKEFIKEVNVGKISHIHLEMPQSTYLRGKPQGWRLTDNGIYLDLMTHLHHMVWFLTGESPRKVFSKECKWCNDVGVVDYVSAQVSYETFQAHLWVSKSSSGHSNGLRVRVYGDKGSMEWYQRDPDTIKVSSTQFADVSGSVEVANPRFKLGHPTGYVEALANLYEAWAEDPSHPVLSPKVAVEGLVLIQAMRESEFGREVSLCR